MSGELRMFDYYNVLYGHDGGYALLDAERPFLSWDFEPPRPGSVQARLAELTEQFPALKQPAPPYFVGAIWRHEVDFPDGPPIGPWQLVAGLSNGWAMDEAGPVPPPPVGRPGKGTAPLPGERQAPSGGALEAGAKSGVSQIAVVAGTLVLGGLVLYALKRKGR